VSRRKQIALALIALTGLLVLEGQSRTSPLGDTANATSEQLLELLNGIDFVPGPSTLPTGAGDDIRALAADDQPTDPGLRIRALRALAHYPGTSTTTVLESVIDDYASFSSGIETLYLRASMRALAELDATSALSKLAPQLNNASRDVRAAAAAALAITGDPQAIPLLRQRLNVEQVAQVRLAISNAIRRISG
jgi:hypothetical protein